MQKSIVIMALVIVVAFFFIFSTVTYGTESGRHKDLIQSMTTTVQSTAVETFDKSDRVQEGSSDFDKASFESKFKTNFDKANNIKLSSESFSFAYLKDGNDIKAIRVTLTDDRNTKYTATVALDIKNN